VLVFDSGASAIPPFEFGEKKQTHIVYSFYFKHFIQISTYVI